MTSGTGTDGDEPQSADEPHEGADPNKAFADETRRLLQAVQSWAQRAMPEAPSGHGGPECQWCPLCQFASILRGEYPELGERIAEAGNAIAGAVRALTEAAATRASGTPGPDARPKPRPRPGPRVQRINLDPDRDNASRSEQKD